MSALLKAVHLEGKLKMPFRKFNCLICDHVYDEAAGDPAAGLAPGTRWEDIPEDWVCPDCGATKADFKAAACALS